MDATICNQSIRFYFNKLVIYIAIRYKRLSRKVRTGLDIHSGSSSGLLWSAKRLFKKIIFLPLICACSGSPVRAPIEDASPIPTRRIQQHVVGPGETLYSIAWRYDMDFRMLGQINNLSDSHHIHPGQVLVLDARLAPPPRRAAENKTVASRSLSTPRKTPVTKPVLTSPRLKEQAQPPAKSTSVVAADNRVQWRWPVNGGVISNFSANGGLNKGIDIRGELGEPVIAASDGIVVYAGSGLRGYGKLLIIKHNDKYLSAYAYNRELYAKEGQQVKAGEKIAEVGSYGSESPRLHFEIRYDGKPVNPLQYLPKQ